MKTRLIKKDADGLPWHIAVAEGKTVDEGIASVRDAFNRPGTNLVVWNDAADLIAPEHQQTIAALTPNWPPPPIICGVCISMTFKQVAGRVHKEDERAAIAAWERTTLDIANALAKTYGAADIDTSDVRFIETERKARFHVDSVHDRQIAMLRTVAGDSTIFAAEEDLIVDGGALPYSAGITLRGETQSLWHTRPWSVCFLAAPEYEQASAHSVPYGGLLSPAGSPRAIELQVFETKNLVVPPRLPHQPQCLPRRAP